MTNSNFKNVKVGQRFRTERGTFVKIRPCVVEGLMRNAVMFQLATTEKHLHPGTPLGLWTMGNVAVSILEDDEG